MADIVATLQRELGDCVCTRPEVLAAHRRDSWVLSELFDLEGRPAPLPGAVVEARSTEHVSRTLALCRKAGAPVVPFGGGSGVCGAIVVPEGAVVLSTRRLDGLRALDAVSLTATFGAGTNGMEAERAVEKQGLTMGHWPQSIELSTVGGWVATRAAGQFSTAYGNIEDLLLDLEVVLPDGSVLRTRRTPRASAGPDLRQLFLGSEGTLGVITEVTLSLRPQPQARRGQAFSFENLESGIEPIRRLMHAGWRPPVVRLYDAAETSRLFPEICPEGRALLILLHEGPTGAVDAQAAGVAAICGECGGEEVEDSVVDTWLETRNHVPSFRALLERGLILDTIEVASTWNRVAELYRNATESLRAVPGILIASAHSSHSYQSGTNLYITFVARPEKPEDRAEIYRECWRRTMEVALAVGAGISHHHGIGRVRRDVLSGEVGETGVALLRAVKRALDPDGLLNPGALLPE